jgi:hypothetical protein
LPFSALCTPSSGYLEMRFPRPVVLQLASKKNPRVARTTTRGEEMQRAMHKLWKPVPLPLPFHLSLEAGNWQDALSHYSAHPYHAPPLDTYELLKTLLYNTPVSADTVRQRFEAKMRVNLLKKKRTAEPVEWSSYWEAINKGDSRTISMALSGAKVGGVNAQIGVAEACAVLLMSQGRDWRALLIDEMPFATVSTHNLITASTDVGRWDLAVELMRHVRPAKGDIANFWPMVEKLQWEAGLVFLSALPKNSVAYDRVLPPLLEKGCSLPLLSSHLERMKVLSDLGVLQTLLEHAIRVEDWVYLDRCVDHLVDIGAVALPTSRVFHHLTAKHTPAAVARLLARSGVLITKMTIEHLEDLRFN